MNNKINLLHHRALRCVYQDDVSTFEDLLHKDNSVTVHQRNIQCLGIELYKVKFRHGPNLLNEIFPMRLIPENSSVANLRSQIDFYNYENPRSVRFGTEPLRSLAPKIWNIIPSEIKGASSLAIFKRQIKKWVPENCPCRLCLNYISGVGFLR